MTFTKSELDMIYQYAAGTKAATLDGLKEIIPVLKDKDLLTKVIVENTIRKLEKIPEPEATRFIADVKKHRLEERDNSIRRQLAAAKEQAKAPMLGHDIMGPERFMEDSRHMITLDVLNNDSPVGYKGECYRLFLSEEGYRNARESERRGEIKIKNHAAVLAGRLHPGNPTQDAIH